MQKNELYKLNITILQKQISAKNNKKDETNTSKTVPERQNS